MFICFFPIGYLGYQEKPFGCERCGRRYKWKTSLQCHQRDECGKEPQYKCYFCEYKTKIRSNWIRHEKTHTNPRGRRLGSVGAEEADSRAPSSTRYFEESHVKNEVSVQLRKEIHPKVLPRSSREIRVRQAPEHTVPAVRKIIQAPSSRQRTYEEVLPVQEQYTQRILIDKCNAARFMLRYEQVASAHQMTEMMGLHTERRYPCDNCGKVYKWRESLFKHRRVECGKTPQFACEICGNRFMHKHHLVKHLTSIHQLAAAPLNGMIIMH